MAFRDLVEGECGGRNPMLKVASHFTKDQGFRDDLAIPHRHTDARPEDVVSSMVLQQMIVTDVFTRIYSTGLDG